MKKFAFVLAMFLLVWAGSAAAQERELTKEEKKALQERIDSLQHADAERAIYEKSFTMEADQVIFKRGETAFVASNTNFVSIDGDRAVVQTAFNIPVSGLNGLGGVTVEGSFSNYDLRKDKKGNLFLSLNVMGTGISARVDITLYNGSNQAIVNIVPNFHSNNITLKGIILPLDKSRVFKGSTL
ncbi:DUF4251 domain-containing protein [Barnesiella viscericola]|uniref:DUF4251 domain-containing protein n=1 Tax=Barnesiella viscericola TaxID=397865 RepID=UPI0025A385A2|nr:DUF4251 domain-containing protein [Barnesiella viscericola]MDM8267925.1 DUF4251 domain-containing protein [Barnesiella viscericola]